MLGMNYLVKMTLEAQYLLTIFICEIFSQWCVCGG